MASLMELKVGFNPIIYQFVRIEKKMLKANSNYIDVERREPAHRKSNPSDRSQMFLVDLVEVIAQLSHRQH